MSVVVFQPPRVTAPVILVLLTFYKIFCWGLFKRSVLKLEQKAKNRTKDEIGRFTPSDWSNRETEAQEPGWARFRF